MLARQQNSTSYPITFNLVDDADSRTGKIGLTPTVLISKNGAAFGAAAGAVTEVGNGTYALAGNATDRNTLGTLRLFVAAVAGSNDEMKSDPWEIVAGDPFIAKQPVTLAAADVSGNVPVDVQTIKARAVTDPGATVAVGTAIAQVGSNMGSAASVTGDVGGKVLGGGTGTMTAAGVRAVDGSGNAVAPAATALTNATWTDARAGYLDVLNGIVAAVWAAATSGMTTAGSIGKKLADWVVGTIDTYTGNTKQTGDSFVLIGTAGAGLTALGTSANQTTLLNRIGAFTGSGVNTMLGFLKAALSKAATLPSDVGGTFDPVTDSVEAIRDTDPIGTAMRGTDNAMLAVSYTAPDNADIVAIKAKTDTLPASPAAVGSAMTLTSGERDAAANALLDLANGIVAGIPLRKAIRGILVSQAGKLSGAEPTSATIHIRDIADTKDVFLVVADGYGNRTQVTLDLT